MIELTKTSELGDNCKEVKVLHVLKKVTSVILDLVEQLSRNQCLIWMYRILQKNILKFDAFLSDPLGQLVSLYETFLKSCEDQVKTVNVVNVVKTYLMKTS